MCLLTISSLISSPGAGAGRDVDVTPFQLELVSDAFFTERVFVRVEFHHRFVAVGEALEVCGEEEIPLQRGSDDDSSGPAVWQRLHAEQQSGGVGSSLDPRLISETPSESFYSCRGRRGERGYVF